MASIEIDQFLPQPPGRVWQALTDSALLARWLMPNDFEPVIGHAFTFRTEPVPAARLRRPRALRGPRPGATAADALQLARRDLDTVVSWSLVPEGSGTRLLITHDGFDDTDPGQRMVMGILGGGWRGHLIRQLGTLLAGDQA